MIGTRRRDFGVELFAWLSELVRPVFPFFSGCQPVDSEFGCTEFVVSDHANGSAALQWSAVFLAESLLLRAQVRDSGVDLFFLPINL